MASNRANEGVGTVWPKHPHLWPFSSQTYDEEFGNGTERKLETLGIMKPENSSWSPRNDLSILRARGVQCPEGSSAILIQIHARNALLEDSWTPS